MKNRSINLKKISKIVDEITYFYLINTVENFKISIDRNDENEEYTIYTSGNMVLDENELENLIKSSNIHHDTEYEEYWKLIGESEENDLVLVARICDSIKINYDSGVLEIILKKKI